MASTLLDFFMKEKRMPSGRELLEERQRAQSLLAGSDAPRPEGPSIFNLRGGGASLDQLRGTARMMGQQSPQERFAGPGGSHPAQVRRPNRADARRTPQGPQPTAVQTPAGPQDVQEMQRNAARGQLAQGIMRTTGRELTQGQRRWIEETAEDEVTGARPGHSKQGIFSRLITGNLPPALTERERKSVLRGAMTRVGLMLLSGRGHDQATLGEAITFGRMYGQGVARSWYAAAEDAGDELRRREAMQDAQQLFDGFATEDRSDLETWQLVRQEARERGMDGVLDLATKELELLSDLPAGTAEREVKIVDGQPFAFDDQGQAYDMAGNKVGNAAFSSEAADERPIKRTFQRPDGTTVEVLVDPYTSEIVEGSEMITGRPDPEADEQEIDPEQAQVAETIDRELTNIRNVIGDDPETEEVEGADRFGAFGTFGRFARWLPAEFEPSDLKQLRAASENILSLVVRQRSGAQATDAEVERLKSFAIPKPGDDEETIRTKLGRMQAVVDTYQQTGSANAAVDQYLQGGSAGGQSEQDVLDEVYGGGS